MIRLERGDDDDLEKASLAVWDDDEHPAVIAVDLQVIDLDVADRMERVLFRYTVFRGTLRELHFVIIVLTDYVIIMLTTRQWLLTSISRDRRSIEVAYVAGDGYCTKPVGFRVQNLGHSVQVAALSRQNGDLVCGNALVLSRAAVELPQALVAGVTLLHAPAAGARDNPNFFS